MFFFNKLHHFQCITRSLRSSSSKLAQLTLEQILEHLDNLRLNLTNTKQNCTLPCPLPRAWRCPDSDHLWIRVGQLADTSLFPFPALPSPSSFQPDPNSAGSAACPGEL